MNPYSCCIRAASLALVLQAASLIPAFATTADPDIFPGARFDPSESAALAADGRAPRVLRSDRPFDIVLNYYRFKRKQGMQVVEEPLAAPFNRIAAALDRGGSDGLRTSRLVQQFHQHVFRTTNVEPARAAQAWRELARGFGQRAQRIGEGDRVTIYRPYISRATFTLIDDTVIVLQDVGGPR